MSDIEKTHLPVAENFGQSQLGPDLTDDLLQKVDDTSISISRRLGDTLVSEQVGGRPFSNPLGKHLARAF